MLFGKSEVKDDDNDSKEPHQAEKKYASINKQATVLTLGVLCFVGGAFGQEFIQFLFDVRVSVDAAGYMQKVGFYLGSAVAGYFIYRYVVIKSAFFEKIRMLDIGFRGTCVCLGCFFAAVLIYVGFIMA